MAGTLSKDQIEDLIVYCGSTPGMWKGEEVSFCCPVHGERNPSCGINAEMGVFNCFACGAKGNLARFLYMSRPDDFGYDNRTPDSERRTWWRAEISAWQFLSERYGLDSTRLSKSKDVRRFEDAVSKDPWKKESIPLWKIAPFHSGVATYEYFYRRGFTESDVRKFMVGYDADSKTVTVPVFWEDGKLAGVIGRYVHPRAKNERFKIYDHFRRSNTLFPLNYYFPDGGSMILVEGQFDAMRLHSLGYRNALSIMTDHLSRRQSEMIPRLCRSVIYIGDNDERGRDAREKNRFLLGKSVDFRVVDFPSEGKDVCDWDEGTVKEVVASAHSVGNRSIRRYYE